MSFAFRDVSCARGGWMLFEHVSFALAPGAAALVTGPNGAGKSSLIRIAAGLLQPTAGTVEVEPARALLSEAASLDAEQPLAAALRFWAKLDGQGNAVKGALDELALGDLAEVPVRLLSTGQRRRAAFARMIASGAPVWLLDEPANGLDTAALARLEAAIARHRAGGGIALVASHTPVALPGALSIELGNLSGGIALSSHPGEGRGPVSESSHLGSGPRRGGDNGEGKS